MTLLQARIQHTNTDQNESKMRSSVSSAKEEKSSRRRRRRRRRTTTGRAGKMRPMVVFRLSFRKRILFAFAFVAFIFGTSFGRGGVSAVEVDDATKSLPSSPAHCDASVAPENGDIGNCTSELPIGQTCRPVCRRICVGVVGKTVVLRPGWETLLRSRVRL